MMKNLDGIKTWRLWMRFFNVKRLSMLIPRHQFIQRLEDMYQRNRRKENYHANAINDFLSASMVGRRDVKVKISNVNAKHKVNEHVDNKMSIGSMLKLHNRKRSWYKCPLASFNWNDASPESLCHSIYELYIRSKLTLSKQKTFYAKS